MLAFSRIGGDLENPEGAGLRDFSVDFAFDVGEAICDKDMQEEPYLAFAVAHARTSHELLRKCQAILDAQPPTIR
jgi:hypothetical protein